MHSSEPARRKRTQVETGRPEESAPRRHESNVVVVVAATAASARQRRRQARLTMKPGQGNIINTNGSGRNQISRRPNPYRARYWFGPEGNGFGSNYPITLISIEFGHANWNGNFRKETKSRTPPARFQNLAPPSPLPLRFRIPRTKTRTLAMASMPVPGIVLPSPPLRPWIQCDSPCLHLDAPPPLLKPLIPSVPFRFRHLSTS